MISKNIDKLFHKYDNPKVPGACIMIIKNGEILFKKAYGTAHIVKHISNRTKTNFRLASVTKQFTAACVLRLIEQKKIKLSDKIIKFLPQLPDCIKNITIENLLNHTSGLPDDYELIPKNRKTQIHDKDFPILMQNIKKLHYSPGKRFRYINTGYCLLSLIIEKVSCQSFSSFLKQYIFKPLGMDTTFLYTNLGKDILNRAYGYEQKGTSFALHDQDITSATSGDGGIYSSVEDLYKWDQALYTDKILSFSSLRKMFSLTKLSTGKRVPYGFGEEIYHFHGGKLIYHGGESCGFRNFIYRIPSKKLSMIFLSNRNIGGGLLFAKKVLESIGI